MQQLEEKPNSKEIGLLQLVKDFSIACRGKKLEDVQRIMDKMNFGKSLDNIENK